MPSASLPAVAERAHGAGGARAPSCTPARFDRSALLAGGRVTVSPTPGSVDASSHTQLSLLGAPAANLSVERVTGSATGAHPGSLIAYSQGDGASFVPKRPFAAGETVTVVAKLRSARARFRWRFRIEHALAAAVSARAQPVREAAVRRQSFRSRPDLSPPAVTVTHPGGEGYVFAAPYSAGGEKGPMIFDGNGHLVWFKPLPHFASDLRVQTYRGEPVLTWWQGSANVGGRLVGYGVIDDPFYREVARVHAGNGYGADLHEFRLTASGSAIVTAYEPIRCNLSRVHGPANGAVWDTLLQEVDVATGLVRFEWHALDHIPLRDSYEPNTSSVARAPWDYGHINGVDVVSGRTLLVTLRNTWAVYDVDRRSGRLRWRLGGKHSTFRFRGARPAWAHDALALPRGHIGLFDNGATPKVHRQSAAIVIALNRGRRVATVVTKLVHRGPLVSDSQGNMQPLPGGGWFVGWGQEPYFSQFSHRGALLFDAHLSRGVESYRGYRFNWIGYPTHSPEIAVSRRDVYVSWNGATVVVRWQLLAGPSPTSLQPAGSTPWQDFETHLTAPAGAHYVQVEALSASGQVLSRSRVAPAG